MVVGAIAGAAYFPIVRRFKRRWRWGKEGTMAILATAAGGSFFAARYKAADLRGILKDSECAPWLLTCAGGLRLDKGPGVEACCNAVRVAGVSLRFNKPCLPPSPPPPV